MTISQTAAKAEAEAEAETEFSRLQVLLAELQATCAELHGAKSAHSLQVRTFYALNELSRLVTLVSAAQLKKGNDKSLARCLPCLNRLFLQFKPASKNASWSC